MISLKHNRIVLYVILNASILLMLKVLYVSTTWSVGFDLTDEGYHLLHYSRPDAYPTNAHNYQYLINYILNGDISLVSLRALWYAINLIVVLYFVYCLQAYYQFFFKEKTNQFALLVTVSGALFISVHDRIIAYNELSNFFVYSSVGSILLGLSTRQRVKKASFIVVGGILIGAEVFIKVSSGLGVITMFLLLLALIGNKREGLYLIAGVVLGLAAFFQFCQPAWNVWWTNYQEGITLAGVAGYGSSLMIKWYTIQFVYLAVVIGMSVVPVAFFLIGLLRSRVTNWLSTGSILIVGHVVSLLILFGLFLIEEQQEYFSELVGFASNTRYYPVIVIPQTIAYVVVLSLLKIIRPEIRSKREYILVLAALVVTPVVILLGAFTPITMSLYGHLAPLLAALFLAPMLFWSQKHYEMFVPYLVLLSTVFCSGFFIHNYVLHPARLLTPLSEQVVEIGIGESIKVDSATAEFVNELRAKVNTDTSRSTIFHIGNQPGIVYLLGRHQQGTAMYISMPFIPEVEPMNLAYAKFYINQCMDEMKTSRLLINAGVHPSYFRSAEKGGMILSGSHVLSDSVYNPYLKKEMDVNNLIEQPYTYIFIPKTYKERTKEPVSLLLQGAENDNSSPDANLNTESTGIVDGNELLENVALKL